MFSIMLLFCTSLLSSYKAKECSTTTPLFVMLGTDAHLEVTEPVHLVQHSQFRWTFNNSVNIVRVFSDNTNRTHDNYKNRATISGDYSLLLKNLQQVDKGYYTAVFLSDVDKCLAEYSITVEDLVSAPELTVESVSNNSDLCVLTVNCSAQDSHIQSTLRYDANNCSLLEGETSKVTADGASLQIKLVNCSVSCNHRNHVSELKAVKKIQHFCPTKSASNKTTQVVIPVTVIGICLVLSIGLFLKRRPTGRTQTCENTIYDTLQVSDNLCLKFQGEEVKVKASLQRQQKFILSDL
ncbi:SLAM family member 5-like [Solea senegalensis]|uniref:SLAM family member 5-like n=1 Tax=Solea senegalensis TaxID=28829 RepID=A0AAV6T7Z7_SOLSE|nr:SLAM family member 5-like [Solea senegalensis]